MFIAAQPPQLIGWVADEAPSQVQVEGGNLGVKELAWQQPQTTESAWPTSWCSTFEHLIRKIEDLKASSSSHESKQKETERVVCVTFWFDVGCEESLLSTAVSAVLCACLQHKRVLVCSTSKHIGSRGMHVYSGWCGCVLSFLPYLPCASLKRENWSQPTSKSLRVPHP